ncbi:hypothetical protein AB3N59_01205 [Leptospira sp. WS92.C1]
MAIVENLETRIEIGFLEISKGKNMSEHWDIRISVYEPDEDKLDDLFESFTNIVYKEFKFHEREVIADILGGTETNPLRLSAYSVYSPLITRANEWKVEALNLLKEKLHQIDPHCRIEIELKIPAWIPPEEL